MARVLAEYYGQNYQIGNLLKMHRDKVVFLNGLAQAHEPCLDDFNLGAISVDIHNVRKSLPRLLAYPRNQGDL